MPYDKGRNQLQAIIGQKIRSFRKMHGATAIDIATAAGISISTLSKIERGAISPSLTTLQSLSSVLGLPLTTLFQGCEKKPDAVFTPAAGRAQPPGARARGGAKWRFRGRRSSAMNLVVEPYSIILTKLSDSIPESHRNGIEFLHVLEGEIVYGHGDMLYHMSPGDSLFFHAGVRHGQVELISLPVHLVAVISHHRTAVCKDAGPVAFSRRSFCL